MNRQQRRLAERSGVDRPDSLYEWLKDGSRPVRRAELVGVVDKLIRLHELKRRRDRPLSRLLRVIRREHDGTDDRGDVDHAVASMARGRGNDRVGGA